MGTTFLGTADCRVLLAQILWHTGGISRKSIQNFSMRME
jgi:hypothetical protein